MAGRHVKAKTEVDEAKAKPRALFSWKHKASRNKSNTGEHYYSLRLLNLRCILLLDFWLTKSKASRNNNGNSNGIVNQNIHIFCFKTMIKRNVSKQRISFEYVDTIVQYIYCYKVLESNFFELKRQTGNDGEEDPKPHTKAQARRHNAKQLY